MKCVSCATCDNALMRAHTHTHTHTRTHTHTHTYVQRHDLHRTIPGIPYLNGMPYHYGGSQKCTRTPQTCGSDDCRRAREGPQAVTELARNVGRSRLGAALGPSPGAPCRGGFSGRPYPRQFRAVALGASSASICHLVACLSLPYGACTLGETPTLTSELCLLVGKRSFWPTQGQLVGQPASKPARKLTCCKIISTLRKTTRHAKWNRYSLNMTVHH